MQRPFSFIHVPKTGGASIKAALGWALGDHKRASQYADDIPRVAFVRNPYTRIQASFHFLRDGHNQGQIRPEVTFREFILEAPWLAWQNPLILTMDEQLDAPIDFLGRYETLAADFVSMCHLVGREQIPALPHIHRAGPKEPYDDEMRAAIRERYAVDFTRFGYE